MLDLVIISSFVSSVDLTPYIVMGNFAYTKCYVTLKKLNKEFQTPGKYQMNIVAKAKNLILINSGFTYIEYETFRQGIDYAKRDEVLKNLSQSGSLVLDVNVTLKLQKAPLICYSVHNRMITYKQVASNHLSLLNDPQFSDFKFIVKGKEFKVHRAILASASLVFTKLFTTDMEEALNSECIVKDIEPEIFEHLLRFIYGGELPDVIGDVSMKLFEAAHYYEIEQLKDICEQEIGLKVSVETAVDFYNWAYIYDVEDLKKSAWEIVKR
jgi:BTB/POZ domain